MPLKYETEIIAKKECNLDRFSERERDAFCFAFDPIKDPRNFVPRAMVTVRDNCESWALSFFEEEIQAENRLLYFTRDKSYLFMKLGTHIASGVLDKNDGISEDCDPNGHFNHHEYDTANFPLKFVNRKKIY